MFTVDAIENLVVDPTPYTNEVGTIQTLSAGLEHIATWLKRREMVYERMTGGRLKYFSQCLDFDGTNTALPYIACIFHWFGGSACNLARLAGFIRGLAKALFTRAVLNDPANYDTVKKSVDTYAKGLPELSNVLKWRNKVGAHFAITDPRKADNIATLNMSVLFPVAFENGRYVVISNVMTQSGSSGTFMSAIPRWSVTEVFEAMILCYWPGKKFVLPPDEPADGSWYNI